MSRDKSKERILLQSSSVKHFLFPSWNGFKVREINKWRMKRTSVKRELSHLIYEFGFVSNIEGHF